MPAAARWRAGGLVLAAALGGASAYHGATLLRSGTPSYWVKLRALNPEVGELDPPFSEDGKRFKLELKDPGLEQLRFHMVLNRDMYGDVLPEILVNGKRNEYDILGEPNTTIALNETIGPFDKEVVIRVQDRHTQKDWFGNEQSRAHHDYKIRITQPPEFQEVIKATGFNVRGENDHVIQPHKQFDGNRIVHNYDLEEADTTIEVQANCTKWATGMKFNGEPAKSGSWIPVDTSSVRHSVTIQCIYFNEEWSTETYEQTYELNFQRNVTYSEDTAHLIVEMMPSDGYCVMKEGASAMPTVPPTGTNASDMIFAERSLLVPWTEAQKSPPGDIVCRTQKADTTLVPLFRGLSGVYMSLQHSNGSSREKILNGFPHKVHIDKGRQNLTIRVTLGLAQRDYAVAMIRAQACEELQCPRDMVSKVEAVGEGSSAWSRLCLEEECSDLDVGHCCVDRASCSTFGFACPEHTVLRRDKWNVLCSGAECTKDDTETCCEPRANCSSYHWGCGHGMSLADKADGIECELARCTKKDRDTCCQNKATCSSYTGGCPAGEVVRIDADATLCDGIRCTEEDEETCCGPRASCRDFAVGWPCPEGQSLVQPPTKTLCEGGECAKKDAATCCERRANCSNLACPAHSKPKPSSEELLCKYSHCSVHNDMSTCCDVQATCASDVTDADCPEGHWLIGGADETYCEEKRCSDDEKAACCQPMASCSEFPFDCPVGHMHRLSASQAHCRAQECDELDSTACCSPIPGVAAARGGHLSGIESADVLEYLHDKPWSIKKVSGSWIMGLEDRDCDSTCEAHGLICTEAGLYAHNADVDSREDVLDLMKSSNRLDLQSYDGDCPERTNVDIPVVWASGCFRSAKKRLLKSFNCSAKPIEDPPMMKHRLCYCHEVITHVSELMGDDGRVEVSSAGEATAQPLTEEQRLQAADSDATTEIFELLGGLITSHDCWHVDFKDWSTTQRSWCSHEHGIHVAANTKTKNSTNKSSSRNRYWRRSLVMEEGESVGDFSVNTLDECAKKCDAAPQCNSFSFSYDAGMAREGCNLKSKVVTADEAGSDDPAKGDYKTYYKNVLNASADDDAVGVLVVGEDAPSSAGIQRLHATRTPRDGGAWATSLAGPCALAAGGVALALLALALRARASARVFDRLPHQPSPDAPPTHEPLVAATAE